MNDTKARILAIVDAVCAEYGVTPQALHGESMIRAVVEPRQVAAYLARRITGAGFWEVGRHAAGYSERSASRAAMKIWRRLESDRFLAERIARIESALVDDGCRNWSTAACRISRVIGGSRRE